MGLSGKHDLKSTWHVYPLDSSDFRPRNPKLYTPAETEMLERVIR